MNSQHISKEGLDRRQFLGAGTAAALAVAAGSVQPAQAGQKPTDPLEPFNERTHLMMPTRNLGKTGYRVGIFSLGCQAAVEQKGKEDIAEAILNRAIDLGVNYLDTAPVYGGGTSEINVGRVVKNRRKEVYLATKTHQRDYDGSMRLLEQSLKRFHTDHLDCWQLHNVQRKGQVDQIFAPNGAMKAMLQAREEGMTRFIGITGHYEPTILAEALKQFDFDTILLAVNAADRHMHSFIDSILLTVMEKNMGIIGMKVATRGRMLSTWTPPPLDKQPKRMATKIPGTLTMKEALYYNFSLPVSTNVVGCDNPQQAEEDIKWASEFTPLTAKQMAKIEEKTASIARQALYFRKCFIDECQDKKTLAMAQE